MRPIKPGGVSNTTNTASGADLTADELLRSVEPGQRLRAAVLVPILSEQQKPQSSSDNRTQSRTASSREIAEARLDEALGLAEAIDLEVVTSGAVNVTQIKPATLLGRGKVEELKAILKGEEVELCIVDHPLSPVQQRNLEREWNVKVLDRTGLILEIFGRRARTKEGRLQVELAHLTYQKSRLVRSWTHLERQRGGFGFLGGPGETQIEADRRIIQERISSIRKELETVRRTRELHREGRRRVPFPIVALVGYTNAGKSTLFNRFTGADVQAEDLLFATLDPTMRQIELGSGQKIILSDTVGFISDLPTTLIAAFRATLEEVIEADVILHVRDISHERTDNQCEDVYAVLEELGIDTAYNNRKIIEVWNKADLLEPAARDAIENQSRRTSGGKPAILVSAKTGEGIDALLKEIETALRESEKIVDVEIAPNDGTLIQWLHENGNVLERHYTDTGSATIKVRLALPKLGQLKSLLSDKSHLAAT